ncbi:endonuclease/exonuclease/phosphatase family protein [Actinomadura rugatobispora]|uniref:Endonuclease/exonuclease/phosphatase family protein n=1 Tax=Actinomadura rugatobispora TaxID=1994 RepID=A0ABW1ABL5_9ACTN|nr:endonuclease/exonuclease/phosphatase family protein [Actinomadura rugatobispora]
MSDTEVPQEQPRQQPRSAERKAVPKPAFRVEEPARWRPLLAWAGVVGWGSWAVLRLAGGDRIPGVGAAAAPLLAVTPFVVAASPIPVLVALLTRRWWATATAAAIALALVASVAPRAVGGGQPAAHGPALRVMSVNLFVGEADADALVDLVRRARPDVLSVQELSPGAAGRYERAGLSRLLPHAVLDARWGASGSGLYSRLPLRELPPPGPTQMATPRAALTLPGGRAVEVTAVHPVPPITSRAYMAWKHDIELLPSAPGGSEPVRILAGDFNATLDHATLRKLIGRGYADAADRAGAGLIPTWGLGGPQPPLTLDHVLLDRRCAVTGFTVHDVRGSDHRAVVAEIRLP